MKKAVLLAASHALMLFAGFVLGVYYLPIIVEPAGLAPAQVQDIARSARFSGKFVRDLKGSDFAHWAEGKVYVTGEEVVLDGQVAPGPDYKLYFSPTFVDTTEAFERAKAGMVKIGDVRTFHNFRAQLPAGFDPAKYDTVILWCETFHQFISAAKYR